jgi:hypothetical protein
MTPELEATQTAANEYEVTARPAYGKHVTLYVQPIYDGYGVKIRPDSLGLISKHRTFEAAVKSSTYRARRYLRAYSKPHGLAAKAVAA